MQIYKITNKINSKSYIGQTTVGIDKRWKEHCRVKNNTVISKAIRKYKKENFAVEEIGGANNISELNYLETHFIYMLNTLVPNGYNLSGGGGNKTVHSATRKKLSKVSKGIKRSKCHVQAIREAHSIEIYQYSLDGCFIERWNSSTEASVALGIDNSEISKCCKGTRKSCGGFMWSFNKYEKLEPYRHKLNPGNKKGSGHKPVALIDKSDNIIKRYASVSCAARENNCDPSDVSKVCRGLLPAVKKLKFIHTSQG